MSMKPRLEPFVNKKIDQKLSTEPNPAQGREEYTRLEPFTVSERRIIGNQGIPGVVTEPDTRG